MVSRPSNRRMAVGLGVVLAVLVAVWCLLMPTPPRISTYASRRIAPGMTRGQVEAILGGPAGDYRTPPLRPADEALRTPLPPGDRWQGDRFSVYVTFDAADRVVAVAGFHPSALRPSWYRALQEWAPLPD
jgi:hypothetical protein